MRIFRYLYLTCLFLLFSSDIYSQTTWQFAYERIQNILFQGQLGVREIYVQPTLLQSSSNTLTLDSSFTSPNMDCWFFFIDDNPYANWAHPCRLVYVDPNTLNIYTHNSFFPPDLSSMLQINSVRPKQITQEKDLFKIVPNRDTNNHTNDYAIIISGGVDSVANWERYYNDCAAIYSTLRNRYNYPREHIYVIMSDGTNPGNDRHLNNDTYDSSPLDLDGDSIDDIQYAATYENIVSIFNLLASQISQDDNVFIFTTDHGGTFSELYLWNNSSMTKEQFSVEVNKLSVAKSINILMGQCFSGGYIPLICGDNRVVSTACSAREFSYATQNMAYDEFCYHWIAAVNGSDPYGSIVCADQNNDGVVSITEAFNYAENSDIQSETPQYCSPVCSNLGGYLTLSGIISQSEYINHNSNWDSSRTITNNIIIDSLAILTISDTVFFSPFSRIIVRPGGTLVVDGGTLTNACDGEMWQGIIVEGNRDMRQIGSKQGAVYLTNATIENARTAISTKGFEESTWWYKTGGIIQATNTLFRNNRRTAEFLDYENHKSSGGIASNASYFTRCTFTIDDDNLFAENDVVFKNHVSLWKVRGVKFNGCTFRNETATTIDSSRGKAIYTEEAGFIAQRVCPQVSNLDPCGCFPSGNDPVTRCSFEGFFEAVHASNALSNYDITIDNCDFAQNYVGVELDAADNARVSFCDFDLSGNYETSAGLLLNNSTGYTVESNTLYKQSFTKRPVAYGIMAGNSGTAENVIRKNEFTNLYYGCFAIGINASNSFFMVPGLQFLCNFFSGCSKDISVSDGTICFLQGISSAGADNEFQNTRISSFNLSNANNIIYFYSNTTTHIPYNPSTGVIQNDTATANACASTLCGIQVPQRGTREEALSQYRALAEEYRNLAGAW